MPLHLTGSAEFHHGAQFIETTRLHTLSLTVASVTALHLRVASTRDSAPCAGSRVGNQLAFLAEFKHYQPRDTPVYAPQSYTARNDTLVAVNRRAAALTMFTLGPQLRFDPVLASM
jgi:hypothetical protein